METADEKRKDLIARIKTGQPVSLCIETGTDSKGRTYWRIPCAGGTWIDCSGKEDAEATLHMLQVVRDKQAARKE